MHDKYNKVRYNNQYNTMHYDKLGLMLPKGYKALCAEHAAARGESLNGLLKRALRNQLIADGIDVAAWDALAPDRSDGADYGTDGTA